MKDDETDVPTSVKFCVDTKLQPVHETAFYPYFTCFSLVVIVLPCVLVSTAADHNEPVNQTVENSPCLRCRSLVSYVISGFFILRELCDIGDIGKLTREQFALALYLINQKLTKGLDPPQNLTQEMIPPSDRQNMKVSNNQPSK